MTASDPQYLSSRDAFLSAPAARLSPRFPASLGSRFARRGEEDALAMRRLAERHRDSGRRPPVRLRYASSSRDTGDPRPWKSALRRHCPGGLPASTTRALLPRPRSSDLGTDRTPDRCKSVVGSRRDHSELRGRGLEPAPSTLLSLASLRQGADPCLADVGESQQYFSSSFSLYTPLRMPPATSGRKDPRSRSPPMAPRPTFYNRGEPTPSLHTPPSVIATSLMTRNLNLPGISAE